jgi:hypothetical protein
VTAACSSPTPESGTLVIGLQTQDTTGSMGSVRIETQVDGQDPTNHLFEVRGDPNAFPHEWRVGGTAGARVAVKVSAYFDGKERVQTQSYTETVIARSARTQIVGGQTKLLRLELESRCLTFQAFPPPGWVPAKACPTPQQTCIAGSCADDAIGEERLEPYREKWPEDVPDICRPASGGTPEVIVGTGQTDYLPLTASQTLQVERGPQGGHHIWIALRMRNLKQSGSMTTVSAKQPDSNVAAEPTAFIFTFDRDEGGYCKLYGLRYQLDSGGVALQPFLGKPLDVKVEVSDRTGQKSSATARIQIAPTILQ